MYWSYEKRLLQVKLKSPECIEYGACQQCGCTTPDVLFCSRGCKHGCYEEMPPKKGYGMEQASKDVLELIDLEIKLQQHEQSALGQNVH